jgi:hypothetical protein
MRSALAFLLMTTACGARTPLDLGRLDASTDTTTDTSIDTSIDDTVEPVDDGVADSLADLGPDCPIVRPGLATACPLEGMTCSWNNACGSVDTGTCEAGVWKIEFGCHVGCPIFTPVNGKPCTDASACTYTRKKQFSDEICATSCECTGSGTWRCLLLWCHG